MLFINVVKYCLIGKKNFLLSDKIFHPFVNLPVQSQYPDSGRLEEPLNFVAMTLCATTELIQKTFELAGFRLLQMSSSNRGDCDSIK